MTALLKKSQARDIIREAKLLMSQHKICNVVAIHELPLHFSKNWRSH
jgi:hypothetical protein